MAPTNSHPDWDRREIGYSHSYPGSDEVDRRADEASFSSLGNLCIHSGHNNHTGSSVTKS